MIGQIGVILMGKNNNTSLENDVRKVIRHISRNDGIQILKMMSSMDGDEIVKYKLFLKILMNSLLFLKNHMLGAEMAPAQTLNQIKQIN